MKEYTAWLYKPEPFSGINDSAIEEGLNIYAQDGYKVIHVSQNEYGYLFIFEKDVA